MNAQSMREHVSNGIADTPLRGLGSVAPRTAAALRDALERNDRQILV
jgi:hypothetical protein